MDTVQLLSLEVMEKNGAVEDWGMSEWYRELVRIIETRIEMSFHLVIIKRVFC